METRGTIYSTEYILTSLGKVQNMDPKGREIEKRGTLGRWLQRLLRSQRGTILLETTIALSIFGVVGTAVLSSVSSTHITMGQLDVRSTAGNIARNQLEYTFNDSYYEPPYSYDTIATPQNYAVTAEAVDYNGDPNLQNVRVTVFFEGKKVRELEELRTKR